MEKNSNNRRRKKIAWLEATLSSFFEKNPDKSISKKKLMAQFCLAFAACEQNFKELLKIFENAGKIKVEGDEVRKC